MSNQTKIRKSWSVEEDKALLTLVGKHGTKKWNSLARDLRCKGQCKRTGKQCRQRYTNHLCPQVHKKKWSQKQQETMLEQHELHGNKWTIIASALPGRTDNAIKNYFYSMVRRSLRRMGKIVGERDSTSKMKMIKPATLSMVFQANYQCNPKDVLAARKIQLRETLRNNRQFLCQEIMAFSHFKPTRSALLLQEKVEKFKEVLQKIGEINKEYLEIRDLEILQKAEENKFQSQYRKCMESDSQEKQSVSLEQLSIEQQEEQIEQQPNAKVVASVKKQKHLKTYEQLFPESAMKKQKYENTLQTINKENLKSNASTLQLQAIEPMLEMEPQLHGRSQMTSGPLSIAEDILEDQPQYELDIPEQIPLGNRESERPSPGYFFNTTPLNNNKLLIAHPSRALDMSTNFNETHIEEERNNTKKIIEINSQNKSFKSQRSAFKTYF